jgi:histone deacetylase HOS3
MPLNEASHAENLAVKAGKPPAGPIGKDGRRRKGWKGFYGSVHDIVSLIDGNIVVRELTSAV